MSENAMSACVYAKMSKTQGGGDSHCTMYIVHPYAERLR